MANPIENSADSRESNLTPQGQEGSSPNMANLPPELQEMIQNYYANQASKPAEDTSSVSNVDDNHIEDMVQEAPAVSDEVEEDVSSVETDGFDIDSFVHTSGEGFANSRNTSLPNDSSIDVDALSSVASQPVVAGKKMTRKEKRAAKRELKRKRKEAAQVEKQSKKTYTSVKNQLKDRDKELSDKTEDARRKRDGAKDVVNYIGYNRMYQDGICEVEEGLFSSSIAFEDTSYHSVRDEQQKAMFSAMTRLYDQFGADTLVQMSVINTPLLKEEVGNRQFFDPTRQPNEAAQEDAKVFNEILNSKVREGVSNIRRNRYLTYSVTADTADEAAHQLSRIETESSRILNSIGSKAHLMNGTQRLGVIHSLLNPYKPFEFDYQRDISTKRAQTTKDCIAPTQIDFKPDGMFNDCFKLDNGVYGQVLVMKKFGSELSDRALADLADLPIPMAITWFVQPMDKSKAINFVRTRSAWIDKEIIEEQRSAVNKGYDFSILPQELKYSKEETEDVLDHLQNKNQRLYVFTGLVYTYAESKEKLDTQVLRIISTARQNSIEIDTYDYRQRKGLNSVLPLGHNHVEISRMFTTAQVAILVPFATQELDDAGGNYYGQNKHSRNLVICNRKKLTSPMGFVCGKTGSGKGMFTKTEMTGTIFSNPTDEIYIIDRAGEYTAIAERYGGTTYHFGVGTGTYLNPFDTVSVEHMSNAEQVAFKIDAMLAQAGASAAEAGQSLSEVDQSIIQRCVELAFKSANDRHDNLPPTLQDFYDALKEQPEPQAYEIALRYERFVQGSMDFFNKQSNVDFNRRIVDFNLKDLPDSMLVFALINVCEAVRNRMYYNAKRHVRTWLYVEEMQSMFAYPTVLNYFSRFSNEGRKFGLLLTGITQNAVAMLSNEAAQNIVLNADFLMLLKQSPLDRMKWVELLNLSEQEEECIDETAEAGDGLLIAGSARVPIRGKFPQGNVLYDLFSTNPNESKKLKLGSGKTDEKPVI